MNTKTLIQFAIGFAAGVAGVILYNKYGKSKKPCKCNEQEGGYLNLTAGPPQCPAGQVPAWFSASNGKKGWKCVPASVDDY